MLARKSQHLEKDTLDAHKLRKLLSGMIENQSLELSDNIYKIKGKDTTESAPLEISEKETFVINETQMMSLQKVSPLQVIILNPYVMKLISLLTGKKVNIRKGSLHKNRGCFDRFANTTVFLKK